MTHHLRASLWLLLLTILICSVLYPLLLLAIGQTVFRDHAQGSLVTDADGKVVGSRLIAQPFTGEEYFQPRPSNASYKADASGGSNWGASNYLLRDRVARILGPIVRYGAGADKYGKKQGELVGPDIEEWFARDVYQKEPGIVKQWAKLHSGLAEAWVKTAGDAVKDQWKVEDPAEGFEEQWKQDCPDLYRKWNATARQSKPKPADLAGPFFESFSEKYPGSWPQLTDKEEKGQTRKVIGRVSKDKEIREVFFDMWRQDHPTIPLEEVPADMVTASGSGLDPHITLANAHYQLKYGIAEAQAKKLIEAKKLQADEARRKDIQEKVHQEILRLLEENASSPLGGLAGVPLINVLEVNLALPGRMDSLSKNIK
jgi:K+-transporting ATPase ATPase C chain